ncbi:hypothetical protein GCM10009579_66070 [Streptomyces javensis]|uniref:Uncharacterized protein n=1 Tax=Streptomyces javensis TaxID=114698 RepID=A0ABN1XBM5_9ACTN
MVGRELVQGAGLVTQGAPDALKETADVTISVLGRNALSVGPGGERGQIPVRYPLLTWANAIACTW